MIPALPGLLEKTLNDWTLANLTWVGSFTSAAGVNTDVIELSPDGTKFYFSSETVDKIFQLDLSTPGLISTAVDNGSFFSTLPETGRAHGFCFDRAGTTLYIHDFFSSKIYTFPLGTPWDVTTGTRPNPILVTDTPASVVSIDFTPSGNQLRMTTFSGSNIYSVDLPGAYNIANVSIPTDTYNIVPTQDIRGPSWNDNGFDLLQAGRSNIFLDLYRMSNKDDITSLVLTDSVDLTTANPSNNGGLSSFTSRDGKYIYMLTSYSANFTIDQYSL